MSGQENEPAAELQHRASKRRFPITRRRPAPPCPPPSPIQPIARLLFIRGLGMLDNNIAETLDIPTICPTSMAWILYTNVAKQLIKNFQFETQPIENEVPRFLNGQNIFDTLEEFSRTMYSLEPRKPEEEIRQKKERLSAPLNHLKSACIYGCSLLCNPVTWISDYVVEIKDELGIHNDALLEEHLVEKTRTACETLSMELGNRSYFLHNLTEENESRGKGFTSCSILDCQHVASTIIIMNFLMRMMVVLFHPTPG